jgi:hypothetical protein
MGADASDDDTVLGSHQLGPQVRQVPRERLPELSEGC